MKIQAPKLDTNTERAFIFNEVHAKESYTISFNNKRFKINDKTWDELKNKLPDNLF